MLSKLTERGIREMLTSINECKTPLSVRIRDAETQAALRESEANSLRKISAMLALLEDDLKARLEQFQ